MESPPRHRKPWSDGDLALAGQLMRSGSSNREIAATIGRTEDTTSVMFYKLGLNRGATHCLTCGTAIEQPTVGRKRRYCDDACRTAPEKAQQLAEREAALDPGRSCQYCGTPISLERQRRSRQVLYCRRICSQDAWYARKCAAEGRVPVKQGPHRSRD